MFKSLATIAAVAAALCTAVPVLAADLTTETPVIDNMFDWQGAYVGGSLGLYPKAPLATAEVELGYNFLPSDKFLLGVEGSGLFFLKGTGGNEFWVHAKAGVALDNVALYGIAGVGEFNFGTNILWDVGAGAELALNDHWTIDAEAVGRNLIGSPPTVPHLQAGVRYHF